MRKNLTRFYLHHLESFDDRNLGTTLQHRAVLSQLDCLFERIRLENGIPTAHRPHGAITDGSVAVGGLGLTGSWIAPVYQGAAEVTEPLPPCFHDVGLFGRALRHA